LLPTIYFIIVWAKGTLDIYDSAALFLMYLVYLAILTRIPAKRRMRRIFSREFPGVSWNGA
jgi:hypothetical protein